MIAVNVSEASKTKRADSPRIVLAGQRACPQTVPSGHGQVHSTTTPEGGGRGPCPRTVLELQINPNKFKRTTHLHIVATNNEPDPEPTDDQLWLENIARQVEADARPLFALALAYLFHRALAADQDEPGDIA